MSTLLLCRGIGRDDCRNPCRRDASRDDCKNLYCRDTSRDNRRNPYRRDIIRDDCSISLDSCVYSLLFLIDGRTRSSGTDVVR